MKALYMDDSYLKEFEATVESVKDDKYIVLDQTAFYPASGGVACDTGVLVKDNEEFPVVFVGKFDGKISHEVSKPGLKQGDKVTGKLNWERRYKLMRLHTTAHVLSGIFHNKAGALITGNNIDVEKARMDFSLEDFDREKMDEYIKLANVLVEKGAEVKIDYMKREEALKNPDMIKLANKLPPNIDTLRTIEIVGIDKQADGGAHVKDIKEINKIELVKVENKGKSNRRLYFMVGNSQ
tara:strand:- start:951 stop:1664 length:714 start_codon:yes stop_codon:yes gene_type:complete